MKTHAQKVAIVAEMSLQGWLCNCGAITGEDIQHKPDCQRLKAAKEMLEDPNTDWLLFEEEEG